ncbi:MAG: hypothetical protein RIK87_18240 [Fuerstiella sp.]
MPRFRYEAIDRSGVPIHGTSDADSESALVEQLSRRGLTVRSSTELSLRSSMGADRATLPRLHQLRIGEQLREALLTGLPAHEAVHAIAAEPLSHPILGVAPWLQLMATILFSVAATCWLLSGALWQATVLTGIFALIVVPLLWLGVLWWYRIRPRKLLRALANRLEAGQTLPSGLTQAMPRELRHVMNARIDDSEKARVAADLVPGLLGSNLRSQQFVMSLIGPLVLLSVVILGLHSALLFVLPNFKRIFDDFGMELPALTELLINLSDVAGYFGTTGWLVTLALLTGSLILLAIGLSTGYAAEHLESVPVFGVAFRWAMQARVARILAAMVRNDCDLAESLRAATAGSGFKKVSQRGDILAREMEARSGQYHPIRELSGLPVSMLYTSASDTSFEQRKSAVADTFQSLSEMLDSATVGQGLLLSVIIQFVTVMFTGIVIGVGVLAMFMPLIRLLNNLS